MQVYLENNLINKCLVFSKCASGFPNLYQHVNRSFLQLSKSDSCTLFWLLIKRFATVSTGWKIINSRIPELALPRKRALPDSELLPLIGGDMAFCLIQKRERKKKKKTVPGLIKQKIFFICYRTFK